MSISRPRRGLLAHIIGVGAAALWAGPGAANVLGGEVPVDHAAEAVGLAVLVLANAGGVVLAFFNERRGGLLLVVAGPALSVFAYFVAGRNEVLTAVLSGGPFLISGLLSLTAVTRPPNPKSRQPGRVARPH